jgi:hypothetical protein
MNNVQCKVEEITLEVTVPYFKGYGNSARGGDTFDSAVNIILKHLDNYRVLNNDIRIDVEECNGIYLSDCKPQMFPSVKLTTYGRIDKDLFGQTIMSSLEDLRKGSMNVHGYLHIKQIKHDNET